MSKQHKHIRDYHEYGKRAQDAMVAADAARTPALTIIEAAYKIRLHAIWDPISSQPPMGEPEIVDPDFLKYASFNELVGITTRS